LLVAVVVQLVVVALVVIYQIQQRFLLELLTQSQLAQAEPEVRQVRLLLLAV
jgi:hypothetical protein